jgi:hypothetical protein
LPPNKNEIQCRIKKTENIHVVNVRSSLAAVQPSFSIVAATTYGTATLSRILPKAMRGSVYVNRIATTTSCSVATTGYVGLTVVRSTASQGGWYSAIYISRM